jgi:hypothetical protein
MTLRDFYCYRIAVRQSSVNSAIAGSNEIWTSLHHGGKLFQQYVVNAWIKVESNNLNFYRQNQQKLRVEMYSGLMDYIENQTAANNYAPGRVVVLPSTHQVHSPFFLNICIFILGLNWLFQYKLMYLIMYLII